jgi:hypothetical protein
MFKLCKTSPSIFEAIWRYPEMGVPLNHAFLDEISIINNMFRVTLFMEIP